MKNTSSNVLNILQVGNTDLVAARFNGHLLHKSFIDQGYGSSHCVWEKQGKDPLTWELSNIKYKHFFQRACGILESKLSLDAILYPFSFGLFFDKRFRSADIVHYHLIHNRFFSICAFPLLTRMKPSVWTLHDPWAMTGHCIYPYDCELWKTKCVDCPRLDTPFPMKSDRSSFMWLLKKFIFDLSKFDIIVASKWMLNMARNSPLLSRARLHYIPFGVNLQVFRPIDSDKAKRELGIAPDSLVIGFRATRSEFKGLQYIIDCLRRIHSDASICLLTFDERGLVDEFQGKYQVIDLGWVNDEQLVANALNAVDLFLMPSLAEAFGMMAMEAMACGKPVIVFEGTALPEVIFAPQGGIAVPYGDVEAFIATVQQLIENPEYRFTLGANARELAVKHYNFEDHLEKIRCLYEDVVLRRTT